MLIISIDPGSDKSAFLVADTNNLYLSKFYVAAEIVDNSIVLKSLDNYTPELIIIEEIKCYGMPVGQSVIDTCYTIGRLQQYCNSKDIRYMLLPRRTIVNTICHSIANDSIVRQALLDTYGKDRLKAFKRDLWSALAIYTAYMQGAGSNATAGTLASQQAGPGVIPRASTAGESIFSSERSWEWFLGEK